MVETSPGSGIHKIWNPEGVGYYKNIYNPKTHTYVLTKQYGDPNAPQIIGSSGGGTYAQGSREQAIKTGVIDAPGTTGETLKRIGAGGVGSIEAIKQAELKAAQEKTQASQPKTFEQFKISELKSAQERVEFGQRLQGTTQQEAYAIGKMLQSESAGFTKEAGQIGFNLASYYDRGFQPIDVKAHIAPTTRTEYSTPPSYPQIGFKYTSQEKPDLSQFKGKLYPQRGSLAEEYYKYKQKEDAVSWYDKLSMPQKVVAVIGAGSFGVYGSILESKLGKDFDPTAGIPTVKSVTMGKQTYTFKEEPKPTPSETYKLQLYQHFKPQEMSKMSLYDKLKTGVYKGATSDVVLTGASAYGLGAGIGLIGRVPRLGFIPSLAGKLAIGYTSADVGLKVATKQYSSAALEAGVFLAYTPAAIAGYRAGLKVSTPTYRQMFGGKGASPFEGMQLLPKMPTYREMFGAPRGVSIMEPVGFGKLKPTIPTTTEVYKAMFGYRHVDIIPKQYISGSKESMASFIKSERASTQLLQFAPQLRISGYKSPSYSSSFATSSTYTGRGAFGKAMQLKTEHPPGLKEGEYDWFSWKYYGEIKKIPKIKIESIQKPKSIQQQKFIQQQQLKSKPTQKQKYVYPFGAASIQKMNLLLEKQSVARLLSAQTTKQRQISPQIQRQKLKVSSIQDMGTSQIQRQTTSQVQLQTQIQTQIQEQQQLQKQIQEQISKQIERPKERLKEPLRIKEPKTPRISDTLSPLFKKKKRKGKKSKRFPEISPTMTTAQLMKGTISQRKKVKAPKQVYKGL